MACCKVFSLSDPSLWSRVSDRGDPKKFFCPRAMERTNAFGSHRRHHFTCAGVSDPPAIARTIHLVLERRPGAPRRTKLFSFLLQPFGKATQCHPLCGGARAGCCLLEWRVNRKLQAESHLSIAALCFLARCNTAFAGRTQRVGPASGRGRPAGGQGLATRAGGIGPGSFPKRTGLEVQHGLAKRLGAPRF